jgi:hypothetical protein
MQCDGPTTAPHKIRRMRRDNQGSSLFTHLSGTLLMD